MRIEERCSCGATLTIEVEIPPNTINVQVSTLDRWRELHAPCRELMRTPRMVPEGLPPSPVEEEGNK